MKEKFKLTGLEKSWILYDIGNSAFILLVSTLLPIYFNALASGAGISESDYLAYWGYAGSVATILVAIIGPICGTLADQKFKKPLFMASLALGAIGCAALGAAWSWLSFLVIFVIARVAITPPTCSMIPCFPRSPRKSGWTMSLPWVMPWVISVPSFPLPCAWCWCCCTIPLA